MKKEKNVAESGEAAKLTPALDLLYQSLETELGASRCTRPR
jgi:hypothetical protein